MLTLYYTPGACPMAAHIVLEESGEEYEAKKVDLAGGEQRTEAYPAGTRAGAASR
jgi:glutathione S-transferase